MALEPCRECGQEVSTKAKTCPSCGTPKPTTGVMGQNIGCGNGCLVGLLALVAIAIAVPPSSNVDPEYEPSPTQRAPTPQLSADVRNTGTQILVTNNDGFAWTDCSVELNGGIVRSGYSQDVGRIGRGEQVAGGLMAFTRPGGERFSPATHVVESVDIHCDTPSGRMHYNGVF